MLTKPIVQQISDEYLKD